MGQAVYHHGQFIHNWDLEHLGIENVGNVISVQLCVGEVTRFGARLVDVYDSVCVRVCVCACVCACVCVRVRYSYTKYLHSN